MKGDIAWMEVQALVDAKGVSGAAPELGKDERTVRRWSRGMSKLQC
jgi:hypothetical protein